MKLAILQPRIPHYREEFYQSFMNKAKIDVFVFMKKNNNANKQMNISSFNCTFIKNISYKAILIYNIFTLLRKDYDILVLMLNKTHLSTWILLITKFIHRKKIILWGHGISVKRYIKEEKKPDFLLKSMISLSDGVWLYMKKEEAFWKGCFKNKPIIALENTISGINNILQYQGDKEFLKRKYSINQKCILIFCARFESNYRRTDLLLETIKGLDKDKFGFIIIGAGKYKPDFSIYHNVYDFGTLYDSNIKNELFCIADLYFQPGWVGLSIVEAMAYGLPILTFKRSEETKQCVEYSYIEDGYNGLIFETIRECIDRINSLDSNDISIMGKNSKIIAQRLTPQNMVDNGLKIINSLRYKD